MSSSLKRGWAAPPPPQTLLAVNFFRVKHAITDDFNVAGCRINLAEEAALVPLMAGSATNLIDSNEQRVGVTVVEDTFDFLNVAAFLALPPQL